MRSPHRAMGFEWGWCGRGCGFGAGASKPERELEEEGRLSRDVLGSDAFGRDPGAVLCQEGLLGAGCEHRGVLSS